MHQETWMGQRPQKYHIPTVLMTGTQGQGKKSLLMSFRARARSLKTQSWSTERKTGFLISTVHISDHCLVFLQPVYILEGNSQKSSHFERTWTAAKLVTFSSYHIMSNHGGVKLWGSFRVEHSSCWGCILCLLVLIS